MPAQKFKNMWAAQGSATDQQRSDLFIVNLQFPQLLNVGGGTPGVNLWEAECGFAVEAFPFPERDREMQPIKYLNQTNFSIGADTPTAPINVTLRWAFNRRTAELLERWHQLISNPRTGGVALTSAVKTTGMFYWLIPNMARQVNVDDTTDAETMTLGPSYALEGVLVKSLKSSDANMAQSGLVTLQLGLQIDRYYPRKPRDLTVTDILAFANVAG